MIYNEKIGENSCDIANLFAQFFKDAHHCDSTIENINSLNLSYPDILDEIPELKDEDILNVINNMNKNASKGPDGIPGCFITNCKYSISLPLKLLFTQSIKEGKVPHKWKLSYIVPIYKNKGDRTNVVNYRPITIIR